jgi:hypothetical protein
MLLFRKLASATFLDPKEADRKQIAMTRNCYAQGPMECSTGKE